jgi:hypothetical protein
MPYVLHLPEEESRSRRRRKEGRKEGREEGREKQQNPLN